MGRTNGLVFEDPLEQKAGQSLAGNEPTSLLQHRQMLPAWKGMTT